MAYFINESPVHVVVRPERVIFDPETGRRSGVEREIFCVFKRREAPLWARTKAQEVFAFRGYPQGIEPLEWLAFLDTEEEQQAHGWTDDERLLAETRLRGEEGAVEVFLPVPNAPWPLYASLPTRKNLELAAATGYEVNDLIAYEEATSNRPEVLEEFRKVIADMEEAEEVVSA